MSMLEYKPWKENRLRKHAFFKTLGRVKGGDDEEEEEAAGYSTRVKKSAFLGKPSAAKEKSAFDASAANIFLTAWGVKDIARMQLVSAKNPSES